MKRLTKRTTKQPEKGKKTISISEMGNKETEKPKNTAMPTWVPTGGTSAGAQEGPSINFNPESLGKEFLTSEIWKTISEYCQKSNDPVITKAIRDSDAWLNGIFDIISDSFTEIKTEHKKFKKQIKARIRKLEGEMEEMRMSRLKPECKILQSTVMIRGIPQNPTAVSAKRKETNDETKAMTVDSLKKLGMALDAEDQVSEVFRLPQKEITLRDGKVVKTDTVKVCFTSLQGKLSLYKSLVANGKTWKNIKVHDAIPAGLIGQKKELDDMASDYREKFPGCKTRTLCRYGSVFITLKKAGETSFKKISKKELLNQLGVACDDSESDDDDDEEYDDSPKRKGFHKRRRT